METTTLTEAAQDVIRDFAGIGIGPVRASVPYFNNRTTRRRMSLRVNVGKGSPRDIREELDALLVKHHISRDAVTSEMLTKLLVENNIGIDCSGYAYYILDAESRARGHGHLNRRLAFVQTYGPIGKMIAYLRSAENCGVRTFAHEANSRVVPLRNVKPSDVITMYGTGDKPDRDHILVVTEVDHDPSGAPTRVRYTHAIAYAEDGRFGTGIKNGEITVTDPNRTITEQAWSESPLRDRLSSYTTELRRLKWLT